MELFDKKFVHFMWDDSLEGKKGFFADTVEELKSLVDCENLYDIGEQHYSNVSYSNNEHYPFETSITEYDRYIFFYHDPNYEYKRAWAEGKKLQWKYRHEEQWKDWDKDSCPTFSDDTTGYELRVKSEEPEIRRMTYRELAEWLARGNGQLSYNDRSIVTKICVETSNSYFEDNDNIEVPDSYKIRRWNSDEWIEPTVDVYEADCKKEAE